MNFDCKVKLVKNLAYTIESNSEAPVVEFAEPATEPAPEHSAADAHSLSKLALLIRESHVEDPIEKNPEESNQSSHHVDVQLKGQIAEAFPNVLRLEPTLNLARRARGAKIYGEQKSKAAVLLVLGELNRRLVSPGGDSEAA